MLCKIFGHRPQELFAGKVVMDSQGDKHIALHALCKRCKAFYDLEVLYLPATPEERGIRASLEWYKKLYGKPTHANPT